MGRKKHKPDEGLDVLTEIKEPFSFAGFYETHIVERIKNIKRFLDEKGILFFLLSPFQQRNRLIVQLAVIVTGLLLGVVPRGMHLVEQAQERNAASEMAALIEKETQLTVGSLTLRPLASSQYEKQHLLAFLIGSSNGETVPSMAKHFNVSLSAARGVMEPEKVSYAYEIIPVSENQRLLLIYVDNRKQNDDTGIYNLTVDRRDEEVDWSNREPLEVVLSNTQETNKLFNESGVHLAVLTRGVLNDPNTPIANALSDFEKALSDYELETERIASLPGELTAQPSYKELAAYAKEHRVYESLTDASTTEDVAKLTELSQEEAGQALSVDAGIQSGGTLYDQAYLREKQEQDKEAATEGAVSADGPAEGTDGNAFAVFSGNLDEEERIIFKELESLQGKADSVLQALTSLNTAAQTRYQVLRDYKRILNQEVDVSAFPETGKVSAYMK